MKLEYDYRIHRMSPDGGAIVEYKSPELGSVTKTMIIPFDRGEEAVRRKIIEHFPLDAFYGRWLKENAKAPSEIENMRGKMSVDFDDHFYDIMEINACASDS